MKIPKIPTPKEAPFYWVVGAILLAGFLAAALYGCGPISFAQEPAPPVGTVSSAARCTCTQILPPAAPIAIVPAEGWYAHYGLSYWRDPLGMVKFQGSVSSGNGLDVPVTILPAGYRPTNYRSFAVSEAYPGYTGAARVEIDPDGTVSVTPIRTGAVISLDGIEFLAAP
jgi:hypothetical protein